EGRARDAEGPRRHLGTRRLEEVHGDLEALALVAEEPSRGDPRVVEHDGAGVRRAEAELVLLAPGRDARVAALDEECGDGAVHLREDDGQLGDAAVRDVDLLAVQDVLAPLAGRTRLDRRD